MKYPPEVRTAAFKSRLGEGAGKELEAFLENYAYLPKPEDIIKKPKETPIPEEPDRKHALLGSLLSHATPENFDKIYEYVSRPEMTAEFTQLFMTDITRLKSDEFTYTKSYREWTLSLEKEIQEA